jgi:four helix bundle protein
MESRIYGTTDFMEYKKKTYTKKGATEKRTYGKKDFHKDVDSDVRKFEGELKPLMTEEQKKDAQVLELSYDFSCRIIRLYKYLNEGKLSKADRDIIDAVGRQLLRSATSINANMNEAQHPQSDADFLSKASIALKEARESENWLSLLRDNGYLETRASESLMNDCSRINKILITITAKVKKRLNS